MILLGGYFLFNSDPGFISICGALTALGGMSVYTSLNLKQPPESGSSKLSQKQSLPLSKPKANDEGSADSVVSSTTGLV